MSFVRFLAKESKYLYHTDIKSVLVWVHDLYVKTEENKRPRDPRSTLTSPKGINLFYDFEIPHFAIISKDRQLISAPTNCRDYLNEALRYHVCGTGSHHTCIDWPGKIDMKKLRLAVFLDSKTVSLDSKADEGIKNGVRVANMYGRAAGWRPIRIARARVPYTTGRGEEKEKKCYVLIGDRNWQRTPQYISMLLLLIRICLKHKVPDWITDAYALTGWWHEVTHEPSNNSDIVGFLANSYNHMLLMVAHDREIFPHNMLGGYPSKTAERSFHSSSGLNALVGMDSFHPDSAEKLKHYYKTEVLKGWRRKR